MRPLPMLDRETLRVEQEEIFRNPSMWRYWTLLSAPSRLRCMLRYLTILERCGLGHRLSELRGELRILEPGCAIGSLSSLLALVGEVISIDVSPEAIKRARQLFGWLPQVTFLEADAAHPDRIPELEGRTFDLILMREFLPVARRIAGSPPPAHVIRDYYARLAPGGVLIVEHALEPGAWRRSEPVLQTKAIAEAYRGRVYHTAALDIAHVFAPGCRGGLDRLIPICASALAPLVTAYCFLRRINLSKTIVIQRP